MAESISGLMPAYWALRSIKGISLIPSPRSIQQVCHAARWIELRLPESLQLEVLPERPSAAVCCVECNPENGEPRCEGPRSCPDEVPTCPRCDNQRATGRCLPIQY